MARSRRTTDQAERRDERAAEEQAELREQYIDRTGRSPGEIDEKEAVDLAVEAVEHAVRVDGGDLGLDRADPADLDIGLAEIERDGGEVADDLSQDVELGMGSIASSPSMDTDFRETVSDGYRSPLDAAYDAAEAEIEAESAADAGPADEGVQGGGYDVPGATFNTEEGFTSGPDKSSDSPFWNAIADVFSFGPAGSIKRGALDQVMDEIDGQSGTGGAAAETPAAGSPTDAVTPPQGGEGGAETEEEEETGIIDTVIGWFTDDDDEEESGTGSGATPPGGAGSTDGGTSSGGGDESEDDSSSDETTNSDDSSDGEEDDDAGTDDVQAEDTTDPPPEEEGDMDPEMQTPAPTQEQVDAAVEQMEAEQTWDVTPGWDDPSGDGPTDDTIQMGETRPYVDPYETVDGNRRPDFEIPEHAEDALTSGLGDLVQPTDDDPDGVWGGNDPEDEPEDPHGGTNPAAAELAMEADVEAIAFDGMAVELAEAPVAMEMESGPAAAGFEDEAAG